MFIKFMEKIKREKVEKWLIAHKDILKIAVVERKLGFSRGVISKFYQTENKRKLKTNEISQIDKMIKEIIDVYFIEQNK